MVLVGLQVPGSEVNEQVQPLGCVPLCTFAPLCAVGGADCCGLEVVDEKSLNECAVRLLVGSGSRLPFCPKQQLCIME